MLAQGQVCQPNHANVSTSLKDTLPPPRPPLPHTAISSFAPQEAEPWGEQLASGAQVPSPELAGAGARPMGSEAGGCALCGQGEGSAWQQR